MGHQKEVVWGCYRSAGSAWITGHQMGGSDWVMGQSCSIPKQPWDTPNNSGMLTTCRERLDHWPPERIPPLLEFLVQEEEYERVLV